MWVDANPSTSKQSRTLHFIHIDLLMGQIQTRNFHIVKESWTLMHGFYKLLNHMLNMNTLTVTENSGLIDCQTARTGSDNLV
jgi:hypothetical protein